MSDFLAAAVQLTSTQDPEANFNAAEEQIDLAVRRGAELVGLPENFAFMGEDERRLELAPTLSEACSRFLVTMARRYQVALLGGGFPVAVGDGSRTLNRSELVDRDGQLLAQYDKVHLFDVDLPDEWRDPDAPKYEFGRAQKNHREDITGICPALSKGATPYARLSEIPKQNFEEPTEQRNVFTVSGISFSVFIFSSKEAISFSFFCNSSILFLSASPIL